jgi:hypothetical protein
VISLLKHKVYVDLKYLRFQFLLQRKHKATMVFFWIVTPCTLADMNRSTRRHSPEHHCRIYRFKTSYLEMQRVLVAEIIWLMLFREIIYFPVGSQLEQRAPFGVVITHNSTHGRTPLDERSPCRRGLCIHRTTQHITQEINIHALSGIRTRDPSYQAAADLRLRPRGQTKLVSTLCG